ncbi:hypothetical protein Phum_PHUM115280 [Pediculus humanus corporis]|uniref:Uncharacterized protein n=1 Tax=Pediculus humanus subsp. corporis TaxID=121224 RepID=E0VDG6_PEDHC|nr:uncharacterized protein Phum_PHUM115280 [Pediculus humanus corporis]EEB11422.1 hypothetical protein Phum_PHUM115280 [Pediculus humanus corporis]
MFFGKTSNFSQGKSALSQTPRSLEHRNSRAKQNRTTISFKEYIEAELSSKPVFTTNQGKTKTDSGFENGNKEKSNSATSDGARNNSSPRYSFASEYLNNFY